MKYLKLILLSILLQACTANNISTGIMCLSSCTNRVNVEDTTYNIITDYAGCLISCVIEDNLDE